MGFRFKMSVNLVKIKFLRGRFSLANDFNTKARYIQNRLILVNFDVV